MIAKYVPVEINNNFNLKKNRKKNKIQINRTLQDMHVHISDICKTNDLHFRLIINSISRRNNQYVPNIDVEIFT